MSIQVADQKKVHEVALALDRFPILRPDDILKIALEEMSAKRIGIVCIVDRNGHLLGVFTDGDIRRHLLSVQRPIAALFSDNIIDHAQTKPVTLKDTDSLRDALNCMAGHRIWDLPVVDDDGKLTGLLHLHPLIQAILNHAE